MGFILEISFITSVNTKFIPLLLREKQYKELYQHLNNVLNKELKNYKVCIIKQNKECLIESLTEHMREAAGYGEVKGTPRNKQIKRESSQLLDGECGKIR